MKYLAIVLLAVTVSLSGSAQSSAASGAPCCDKTNGACSNCPGGNNCNRCSQGCKTCRLYVETLKVKKHCYFFECKDVCIPPVRFPWQKCCDLKCGKVKTVRVLKKHEWKCDKCGYKWTVEDLCGSCNSGDCESMPPAPAKSAQALPPLAPATSIRKR